MSFMMDRAIATLTDARGRRIPRRPYRRVISLVPSLTETVVRLGAGHHLVGRTIYCVEPRAELAAVPACGGTKNPDLQALQKLRPDLALACLEENKPEHIAALETAGIPVFAVMPRNLDDVSDLFHSLGLLLETGPQAGRAMADLTASRLACGQFRRHRDAARHRRRTAVLIWKNPWMAVGGETFINAVVQELGLENALADRPDYFTITMEELAVLELDMVLLPDEPFRFSHHDAWSLAAAGVVPDRRRAILLDGKLLSWYGTRTAAALRTLVKLLESR